MGPRRFQRILRQSLKPCAIEIPRLESSLIARKNLRFLRSLRIADPNFHQETVQLSFRQRVRALEFYGILRSEHGERTRQRIAHAVDRHLKLFHRFQQGRLRARGHPVDLVHQQQVGEHRSAVHPKRSLARLKNIETSESQLAG